MMMQGLEDVLKCQNDDDADIFKILQCFFFKFTIKALDRWRHQKRLWRHHFDLSNFWFETKNLTLTHSLNHQYRKRHFSKT